MWARSLFLVTLKKFYKEVKKTIYFTFDSWMRILVNLGLSFANLEPCVLVLYLVDLNSPKILERVKCLRCYKSLLLDYSTCNLLFVAPVDRRCLSHLWHNWLGGELGFHRSVWEDWECRDRYDAGKGILLMVLDAHFRRDTWLRKEVILNRRLDLISLVKSCFAYHFIGCNTPANIGFY